MNPSPSQASTIVCTPLTCRHLQPECTPPTLPSSPIGQSHSLHFIYPLFYDQALLLNCIHGRRIRDPSTSKALARSPMNLPRQYIAEAHRNLPSSPLRKLQEHRLCISLTTRRGFRTESKERLESLSLLWIRILVNRRRWMVLRPREYGSMIGIVSWKRMMGWRMSKGSVGSRRRRERCRLRFSRIPL